ncbi:MAG TPA: hypothetical protein PK151_04505 [Caldisericia bacterium]|nr:hypothetical protein [Caldisericia bacterium]
MNYKEKTIEELQNIILEIQKEIASRTFFKKVIYEHPCKGSARHHLNKYKHWAKKLTSLDMSKTNGYAFGGDFLKIDSQNLLEINSLVIEFAGCSGSSFRLEKIINDGKSETLATGNHSNFIDFLREVEKHFRG